MSSIVVPDHAHVTIGEYKTLEHMLAVNKDETLTNLGNLFLCGYVCLLF